MMVTKFSHFGMHKNHGGGHSKHRFAGTRCDSVCLHKAKHFVTPLPGIGNGAHMLSHILRKTR